VFESEIHVQVVCPWCVAASSSIEFIINKDTVDNNIFTGVHAMLCMIGESPSIFVLSNAIRLNIFHAYLSSFDKVPFVDHCRAKIESVESLD